jgi:hypothetical protein
MGLNRAVYYHLCFFVYIYIDELISRLSKLNVGCFLGHKFAGVMTYADDVTLMAPTYEATMQMLKVCEECASDFDVLFNSSKSQVVLFNSKHTKKMLKPIVKLNGDDIEYTQKAIHLGTVIGSGADQANIKKAISDLHVSTNMLASTFSHCSSDVLCSLFKTNCTSFYGSPLWNLDQTQIIQLHISWRKCIRKLFGLHPRTRSKYIPSLVRCSDLPVQLLSRFANFWYKCSFNANTLVSICAKLSLTSLSIAACNLKLLAAYLSCDASSLCMLGAPLSSFVQDQWKRSVSDGEAALASAVAELRDVVRGHSSPILSIAEARRLLLEVCLSEV